VLTRLFTKLVEDSLNEYAYAATLAELKYSLMSTVQGIQVLPSSIYSSLSLSLSSLCSLSSILSSPEF
jgi:secreted Zn-dependent insulinase-like peptidase